MLFKLLTRAAHFVKETARGRQRSNRQNRKKLQNRQV